MAKVSLHVFQEIETRVKNFSQEWESVLSKLKESLPPDFLPKLDEYNSAFSTAKDRVAQRLRAPVLTLATTGTTSSGKSTLVNMLCGVQVLPIAQREKSSGTVTIRYSDTTRLHIQETSHALWPTGVWDDLSEREIYDRLDDVMDMYHKHKDDSHNAPSPPEILINYPNGDQ